MILNKIKFTDDTTRALLRRKAELIATNDILMAPKRASMREEARRNDLKKAKPKENNPGRRGKAQNQLLMVGNVLPKDHPEVPKICTLVKQIYQALHDKELLTGKELNPKTR